MMQFRRIVMVLVLGLAVLLAASTALAQYPGLVDDGETGAMSVTFFE